MCPPNLSLPFDWPVNVLAFLKFLSTTRDKTSTQISFTETYNAFSVSNGLFFGEILYFNAVTFHIQSRFNCHYSTTEKLNFANATYFPPGEISCGNCYEEESVLLDFYKQWHSLQQFKIKHEYTEHWNNTMLSKLTNHILVELSRDFQIVCMTNWCFNLKYVSS